MEMASHRIEVLLNFMELPPREVSAFVDTIHPEHKEAGWAEKGVDNSDALLIRFDGGKMGIHSTTLITPPRRDMATVEGTKGRIMIDSLESGGSSLSLETEAGGRLEIDVIPLPPKLFDMPMIDDFARCAAAMDRGETGPLTVCPNAL